MVENNPLTKKQQREIAFSEALGRTSPTTRAAEFQYLTHKEDRPIRERALKLDEKTESRQNIETRLHAIKGGMTFIDWLKPMLVGLLLFFFIAGPGASAIFVILKAMNLWLWIGLIFFALIIFRNWRGY